MDDFLTVDRIAAELSISKIAVKHVGTENIGSMERLKEIEVIGNIHENPELLHQPKVN